MSYITQDGHAVVTGASSGIGFAIAMALIGEGMHVLLVGRDESRLAQVMAAAEGHASTVVADLTSPDGIDRVAAASGPRLDVLVHSAGIFAAGHIGSMSAEQWSALNNVNVRAPLQLTSACLPQLRAASGQVVFVNSSAGWHVRPAMAGYAAAKHALRVAVDALRQELNPDGIRVLSIFPGRTDTPMQRAILATEGRTAPPGTLMRAEDIAIMVLAALKLPRTAEVTDILMRPMQPS